MYSSPMAPWAMGITVHYATRRPLRDWLRRAEVLDGTSALASLVRYRRLSTRLDTAVRYITVPNIYLRTKVPVGCPSTLYII